MKRTIKDFIFEKSLLFLALLTLAGLAGIVWFLFKEGMPVLDTISLKHFLTGHDWYPTEDPPSFGIFPLIIGSVSVTLLAAVLAYGTECIERGHPAGSHGGSDDLHHF